MALPQTTESEKLPFDIPWMFRHIEKAVKPFPKAALFELAEQGYSSLFEQLVACVISIRTLDEVTLAVASKLFAVARTPEAILKISIKKLDSLLQPATFHESKAYTIKDISTKVVKEFKGELPCSFDVLTGVKGVGPKCANLVLGIACGKSEISVDTHVHRITNRWGYVKQKTPEKTLLALKQTLPKRYWIDINRLLVPFGKHICTWRLPKCSSCPVRSMCRQVGVSSYR